LTAEGSLRSSGVPSGGVNSAQPKVGCGLPTFGVLLAGEKGGWGGFEVRQTPSPLLAQHTETMRVVHIQPCIMLLAQRQHFAQRSHVAIHAEYRIGDD
jgi:hypothetical protein